MRRLVSRARPGSAVIGWPAGPDLQAIAIVKLAGTGYIAAASRHRTRDATRALAASDPAGLTEKDIAPLCRGRAARPPDWHAKGLGFEFPGGIQSDCSGCHSGPGWPGVKII